MGKFINLVYKPTISSVEIKLDNGTSLYHKLVRNTAKNGLFVSKYVANLEDLESVFRETYQQDIASLRFIVSAQFYETQIDVHFYKVPFNH
jgi:hypothetical protein